MTRYLILVFIIVLSLLSSCLRVESKNKKYLNEALPKSRVEYFNYGGYTDTIYAIVYGQIYEMKQTRAGKDTLISLSDVEIRVEQNNKLAWTNSKGEFEIGFERGLYSMVISRQGYEPIQLTNYVSDPDQVSMTKIILVQGRQTRTFEIPDWKP